MRRWLPILLLLGALTPLQAQTDAPPEREHPTAPDELPPLPSPTPRVKGTLQLQFAGISAFRDARLRDAIGRQIQTIEDTGLDAPNAYDAAFFLESFYRKQGYSQVEVNETIQGPWSLLLTVREGPLTHLGTITVTGNKAYNIAEISKYLLGPTKEHFPRIREVIDLPFVEADIQNGAGLVTRLYASEGYLNAIVDRPIVTLDKEDTVADVTLNVHEGIQYHFGEIKLIGPLVFPREALLKEIEEQTKDIYTEGRLAAAQRKLEDYYKARGYFEAEIQATGTPEAAPDGRVPVVFQFLPGAKFRFDGTTVSGNSNVRAGFVQKRLQALHGQTYNPALIDKYFRTLIGTGLFRNVRITPKAIPGDQVRLDVAVEEAKTKEFGVGLGYATFDGGIVNLSYSDLNLFHSGRPLTFSVELTQRGYSGELVYSDPWFLDSDYSLKLRLYALTRELKGYSKNELGFSPTIGRKITDHWEVSAFILAKTVQTRNILIEPENLVGRKDYSVASVGLSQVWDYRNNIALPTSGFIVSTAIDFAPNDISDISFLRAVGRVSYYIPITARSSLALGARAGIISSLNSEVLPIDERFFNGGATSVRSFSELTLGPRDHAGYPLGGQAFTIFNAEYTFPLIGDLYGTVFFDAGNVVSNAANFGLENMRYGIGGGLRYNLPIGSIRLDYGLNPDPRPGEAQGAFHFAIGVAF